MTGTPASHCCNLNINIMETLIGLLFILLPVVFKLIGKKLEDSGKTEAAKKLRDITEGNVGWDFKPMEEAPVLDSAYDSVEYETVRPVKQEPVKVEVAKPKKPVKQQPAKVVSPVEKVAVTKEKEKIDLKKLIVYSEIMKPKYEE